MKNNVWGVKVYTKTVTEGGNREMWGVIEAPIHKMLKAFPDEFWCTATKHGTPPPLINSPLTV